MNIYNYGPGSGIARYDAGNACNPGTGKPADLLMALDDVGQAMSEANEVVNRHMQNVPHAVCDVLHSLVLSIDALAAIIRKRVVTEPFEEPRCPTPADLAAALLPAFPAKEGEK